MISRIHLTTLILIAAIVWGLLLIIDGIIPSISWLRPLGAVIGVLMLSIGAFDRYLWRIRPFRGWLSSRPILSGSWIAEFVSSYHGDSSDESDSPPEAYMSIHQTYSNVQLRLMTEESYSVVLFASLEALPDGSFQLGATYRNEPNIAVRDRSPIHNGSLLLNVPDPEPTQIVGYYWTDRLSRGELKLIKHHSTQVNDFDGAQALFRED